MEQENKNKRARDEGNTNREKTSAKKQNLNINHYNLDHKTKDEAEDDGDIFQRFECSSRTPPAVEVFDFPWLKEGVISKSSEEDWKFEDAFALSLEDSCCCTPIINPGVLEIMSAGQRSSCRTPAASFELLGDYAEDKLEDDLVESVDGFWSSLLNLK